MNALACKVKMTPSVLNNTYLNDIEQVIPIT